MTGIPGIAVNDYRFSTDGGATFSAPSCINTFAINTPDLTPPPVGNPEPGKPVALSLFGWRLSASKGRRGRD